MSRIPDIETVASVTVQGKLWCLDIDVRGQDEHLTT